MSEVSKSRSLSRLNAQVEGPRQDFKLTFSPLDKTVAAGPVADNNEHHEGLPGSVLDWAMKNGIDIDHACGGFAACSTCHVIIESGYDSCNEISDEEDEMLDEAPGLTMKSRLACQCIANGSEDLVVKIPSWNRNLAKESHD